MALFATKAQGRLALLMLAAGLALATFALWPPGSEPALSPPDPGRTATLTDRLGNVFEPTGVAHLDTALTYVGVQEEGGNNRGPDVDRFIRLGVFQNPPIPWCAAFTAYVLRAAGADVFDQRGQSVLSAVATRHITHLSVDARDVLRGAARPSPGDLAIWRNGSSWTGHIELVVEDDNAAVRGPDWYLRCGLTVGGNTSPGGSGSQRDGDGVWRKVRCIEPGAYFRIVAFTAVEAAS